MATPTNSVTGIAGSIQISSTVVPITKASPKVSMEFADSTDSSGYNPTTGNLYKSQKHGDTQLELSIEGYYDKATTSPEITQKLQSPNSGPWPIVVNLDTTDILCSGNFDFTDFSCDLTVPGATMVSFTLNAKSNGQYTLT